MPRTSPVTGQIEQEYPALPPRLKKAARHVVKTPTEVAIYSLRTVAERAGVAPTTFVRLAAHLGFPSYAAFREALREDLHQGTYRYTSNARELQHHRGKASFEQLYRRTGDVIVQNIRATFDSITAADIAAAGRLMCTARHIYVVGMRVNYSLAFYLHYALRTFMENVTLLDSSAGLMVDEVGRIGPRDVLVAITYEPYAIESVRAAEQARGRNAKIIALTDTLLSPVAKDAAATLVMPACGTSLYQSLAPSMAVLEGLVSYVAAQRGKQMIRHVQEEFERREALGVYWRDGA